MLSNYKEPNPNEGSFTCPHCNVHSQQTFYYLFIWNRDAGHVQRDDVTCTLCHVCGELVFWKEETIIYPDSSVAPMPNPDMPEGIKNDYMEARIILEKSPRGAAALLRLCIQKLCKHLGEPGKDINKDIGSLVEKGLPKRIQKSLDILRVIGNESVHPGQINLNETPETARSLFKLVNLIVDDQITQPKEIDNLYETLPENKRKGIEQRDSKS